MQSFKKFVTEEDDMQFEPIHKLKDRNGESFTLYRSKKQPTEHALQHDDTKAIHHMFSGRTQDVKQVLDDYEWEDLPRP